MFPYSNIRRNVLQILSDGMSLFLFYANILEIGQEFTDSNS